MFCSLSHDVHQEQFQVQRSLLPTFPAAFLFGRSIGSRFSHHVTETLLKGETPVFVSAAVVFCEELLAGLNWAPVFPRPHHA